MAAWLYAPEERRALGDVAKLAAALRSGSIAAAFLDHGADARGADAGQSADVALGAVGRVTLLAPADLALPSPAHDGRRFVLARGTDRWCLAEVVAGVADGAAAERLVAAAAGLAAREGREVVAWLVAARVSDEGRAVLAAAGAVATSTESG